MAALRAVVVFQLFDASGIKKGFWDQETKKCASFDERKIELDSA